jgi:hypothetical protein
MRGIITHGILQQYDTGDKVFFPGAGALTWQGYAPTLTYYAPYEVYIVWNLAPSGATWEVTFDNGNSITSVKTTSGSTGTSTITAIPFFATSVTVTITKTNNGGVTQDVTDIYYYKNSGTLLDSKNYLSGVSAVGYGVNLTGLAVGDVIYVDITEG